MTQFTKYILAVSVVLGMICRTQAAEPIVTDPAKVDMDHRTKQLQGLRFGMFVCWSFSTFSGQEWTKTQDKDASYFRATGCDTDQWCRTAKEAGMGYILFLSKHHDGFCLWETATTEKKVTNSRLGIDVLAKLRTSCDKHGIKLALYFSEGDWNWPGAKDGQGGRQGGGINPEVKKAQLQELLTQYGPIEYIWFDHAVGTGGLSHSETIAWCKRLQPGCFIGFNHGNQSCADIRLGEMGRPGPLSDSKAAGPHMHNVPSKAYRLAEFTYPILPPHQGGAMWFYSLPKHDHLCLPAEKIYGDYLGAKKYGNIYSLDAGPNYEGKLRAIDVATLQKVGRYIRGEIKLPPPPPPPVSRGKEASASSVWQANPGYGPEAAFDDNSNTRWGAEEKSRSGWLAVDLGEPVTITDAMIDEGTWNRVRRFELQYREGGEWKTMVTGATLGPKKQLQFAPVRAQQFRLNILEADEVPTIHEFELRSGH